MCSSMVSLSWLPIECTGLRELIGSWKIMVISRPRMERMSRPVGSRAVRSTAPCSRDRNVIVPASMRPGRGTMPRMERAVTLLPHPLSPIRPRVEQAGTEKSTPSTALRIPSSVWNQVFSPRTVNRDSAVLAGPVRGALPDVVMDCLQT